MFSKNLQLNVEVCVQMICINEHICFPVSSQLRRPVRNVPLGASAQTGGHLFSAVLAITPQRGPGSVNPVQQGSTAPQQVSLVALTGKNISQ